ncbi:Zinc finger BED domain-containing protein 5 [Thelohanellus kitauei]|uniref:Zinc finger BED domain-containing protein 5 n=1 Tax=Thelohanellus kitauei TaxID=669202 RepID=A0A0C2MF17_THEKT|nr:Zinc finger BED domain-containing protein 5 [Thelohanellus kitauei]
MKNDMKLTIVKKRNYNEEYLRLGFTSLGTSGIKIIQCVICGEALSVEPLKPIKLQRHIGMLPNFLKNDTNYFRLKADGVKKTRLDVLALTIIKALLRLRHLFGGAQNRQIY